VRFRFAGVYLAQKGDQLVSVPYAKVSVYLAGSTTPATIYTTADGPNYISQTPQITTNKYGEFEFYIDQNDYSGTQKFKIVCEKPGYETKTWDNVCILPTTQEVDNIRNIPVTGLEGTIQTADLLYYEGTKFIVRNIDEILERFYSDRQTFDLLQYDGTNFQVKNIDEIVKDYYSPSVNDILRYNGTNFEKVSYSISKSDKISDLDGDTVFETERNADEDIIRGKSGGQDIFYGYSDGIFDLVKQSGAKMKLSTNQTIPNDTWTKLNIDGYDWDIQGEVDTANGKFTATRAGKYLICGVISFDANGNGVRHFRIDVNGGAGEHPIKAEAGSQWRTNSSFGVIRPLSPGDYLEFYVYQNCGTNLQVMADHTRIAVVKIF